MASPLQYFRDSFSELRRVSWPSRETVVAHTILVVIISLVVMALLYAFDLGLTTLLFRFATFLSPTSA